MKKEINNSFIFMKIVLNILILFSLLGQIGSVFGTEKVEIVKIYTNLKEDALYFDSTQKKQHLFHQSKVMLFTILASSQDKHWTIVSNIPKYPTPGNISEIIQLYYLSEKKVVPDSLIGGDPFHFLIDQKGEYIKNSSKKKVYLRELLKKAKFFQSILETEKWYQ